MIDAKDLRIGNIFFDEDQTPCYYAGSWQRSNGWIHRDSANNTYKETQMYPIPLTPDILQKCGLRFIQNYLNFKDGTGDAFVGKDNFRIFPIDGGYRSPAADRYVD